MKITTALTAAIAALTLSLAACENNTSTTSTPPTNGNRTTSDVKPDNTRVNERDRASDAKTAGMQGQKKPDIDITAEIRRRITDTKMSVDAQNAKIVTVNGMVTLRGPVKTQEEKDMIGRVAGEVAGADRVDNQLEVRPANP
jgi:osmotically-inducible protein OsmY